MANINIKNLMEKSIYCLAKMDKKIILQELSEHLNNKFNSLKSSLGHIGENKLLLITSITVMDEYFETKKKIDKKKQELENLTDKFKELKSLVYDYKDLKEKQIVELIDQNKQIKIKFKIVKIILKKLLKIQQFKLRNF